ncbi:MAG: aminotransferase class I/II-fold pyridoxal phosphate-dependent enzyme [Sterolibacterium sp.]|jgi:cystathionine beta-lyase/cystathionine gamma-synthase|nr:aminotransferase class I/II-fold pyridoxal phosphate-dependent enzyme [Sterolibacterium sp.]
MLTKQELLPLSFNTQAVHAGEVDDAFGSPRTPLYSTTTFRFDSTADLLDVIEGRSPGCIYTRYGSNPTINTLEAKLAALCHAEAALGFGAGMAAISALFLAHGQRGIVCIGDLYGGTWQLLNEQLSSLGIRSTMLLGNEIDQLPSLLEAGAGLVYFESPGNPTLEILDIPKLVATARAQGALTAIDNTFASPVNQQPHDLGVDLVVQSATKYLGGHSDITAGVVSGRSELIAPIAAWRKNLGQIISPEVAHLLSRSLATLEIRVLRQNENAAAVAAAMENHPRIKRVFYPGLPSFPGHAQACHQMNGFGGILTIEIDGSGEDATKVIDYLRIFSLAPSLGGIESLATQPSTTSHRDFSPAERKRRGISDTMLRLSIGLESPADLIADLKQALDNAITATR